MNVVNNINEINKYNLNNQHSIAPAQNTIKIDKSQHC